MSEQAILKRLADSMKKTAEHVAYVCANYSPIFQCEGCDGEPAMAMTDITVVCGDCAKRIADALDKAASP